LDDLSIERADKRKLSLAISYLALSALKPYPRNARLHSKKQIRQIADAIETLGFNVPILIDGENTILAGHARAESAKLLGLTEVPCVRLDHMSKAQKRAFILADNKLSANSTWDEELLASEIQELIALDKDFDIGVLGFSGSEIDGLIEGLGVEEAGNPKDDRLPEVLDGPAVTRPGDLWILGKHRLLCGSALSPEDCATLMGNEKAQFVLIDPPYNVPIAGHVSGLGAVSHPEFAMASGEMSREQFTDFLETAFRNLAAHSIDGSIHMVFMDWRHMGEIQAAGERVYSELKNLIVWVKDNGGMGSFYRSRHELIFAFKNGTAPHINSFELGQHGRYRTNVWTYKGMNSFGAARNVEIALHPTVKPVAMLADSMKDVSTRGSIVLDVFGGSGSTLIAAQKTGRRGYLMELDPRYCDRIIRRWQVFARDDAVLASTGETFDAIAKSGRPEAADANLPVAIPSITIPPEETQM
jgi:DNA modification methylase